MIWFYVRDKFKNDVYYQAQVYTVLTARPVNGYHFQAILIP
jgi:hypothetical protein